MNTPIDLIEKDKGELHFKEADFSTLRKIDNPSILEMMKYDVHLLDTPRICPTNLKSRFNEIITRYISAEKRGIEQEMDYCLIQLSNLLLGSTNDEDIRDHRFMDLHLRVQRYLRNPVYRAHTMHLLGVCLFSNLLLEIDIDLLTLARTKRYFFPALEYFNIKDAERFQDESKHDYYPGEVGSEMNRRIYPAGELFAVKLRNYLKDKTQDGLRDAVCYFFDPFIWLNLYHDWGYIYELEDSYSKEVYKEVPEGIEPIIEELNDAKDKIGFKVDDYRNNKDKLKEALDYILSLPLCLDSAKDRKVKKLKALAKEKLCNERKPNHGIVSSLILYDKFLDVFKNAKVAEYVPPNLASLKEDFLEDELGAICLHALDLPEESRLSLTDSPHYFLLKFADVLSDWGRPLKGKISLYDFSILDHILFGFNLKKCTKLNGHEYEEYEKDKYGLLINIIFDFSNNERLLAGEIGRKNGSEGGYPRRKSYEFQEFLKKKEELQSLDYSLTIEGEKYQWFFFNLVLIDRYGERFLIENSANKVDLWWIIPPLFKISEKLKGKEFSRLKEHKNVKFEHELEGN